MKNIDLTKEIVPSDNELKEMIINYVGNFLNPDSEEITVEQIIEVFAKQFPEFLLALAEENWVNGYTQALNDVNYLKDKPKNDS
tara:strand:+ start:439 stop:690 length:252 start_codon:yes stop_codon:yes gene_type:complete